MDEISFDWLLEEYTLPATIVPLEGWKTADLVTLSQQIDVELQKRAHEDYRQEVENDYREHTCCY